MSETSFSVKGNGVGRVRLEPTTIIGMGSPAYPQLVLPLKFQLLPLGQMTYTLLRVSAKIYVGNENHPVATVEHPSIAEDSMANSADRTINLTVPLTLTQIKHIEDIRDGKNLLLRITLSGLVALKPSNEFEKLQDMDFPVPIPRSHWIDTALKAWGVSDLRLLEIKFPGDSHKEMATARARLERAEELYRAGDYPHVLTQLRSAFDAIAEAYSQKGVGKEAWETDEVEDFFSAQIETPFAVLSQKIKEEQDKLATISGNELGTLFVRSRLKHPDSRPKRLRRDGLLVKPRRRNL
jgi:hypothetical protein